MSLATMALFNSLSGLAPSASHFFSSAILARAPLAQSAAVCTAGFGCLVGSVRRQIAGHRALVALDQRDAEVDQNLLDLVLVLARAPLDGRFDFRPPPRHGEGHVEFHRDVVFHQVDGLDDQRRMQHGLVVAGHRAPRRGHIERCRR